MNAQRRKSLRKLIEKDAEKVTDLLTEFMEKLQEITDDEQNAYDNMPESLQDSEKGTIMTDNVDTLEGIYGDIEDALSTFENACDEIRNLIEQ